MGRGPTAYFLFSDENRASAKAELEAQPDGKKGVAQVAKLIGQRWAALSDEEKQKYKERAQKMQGGARARLLPGRRCQLLPGAFCRCLPPALACKQWLRIAPMSLLQLATLPDLSPRFL